MLEIGAILQDRYEIIKPIGQGGMGAVYLARDQRLGNTVALKETFFADAALLAAFEREARLLAGLRHAALPKVIDHFADHHGQFLVMEYIPGDDLHDLLEASSGPAPLKEVLQWAEQLLDALDYLHAQEPPIIHRDIKPQNLKLTARNQIVLLDFGLAKGKAIEVTCSDSNSSIFGYTPCYAPLEQVQGSGTDARSDIYSLAATLYHLLTGVKPVDVLTRASGVLDGQPDPLAPAHLANPRVPARVSDVLTQAMALNKNQRIASAARMRELLREASAAGGEDGAAKAAPLPRTELNSSGGPAPLPGDSTHLFTSAPATSAHAAGQTSAYTTRAASPIMDRPAVDRPAMDRPAPARLNQPTLNRPMFATAVRRPAATIGVGGGGASSLPKVIAAAVILAVAIGIVTFVFTRGVSRNDANATPVMAPKNEAATGPGQAGDSQKSAAESAGGSDVGDRPAAASRPAAGAEQRAASTDTAGKEEEAAAAQAPGPEEPARDRGQTPALQEPEGTRPLPRKPEEEVRSEPVRQEPARREEPPVRAEQPPPHQFPPPHYPPPPPGGMPPPGRRRP